ncbi:MAG TPA: glycosyltransferase 61 family protein [Anaerolineales bacterium]|nr:glycosyltransferase 61 family protein [Anaerolineales bacterium]
MNLLVQLKQVRRRLKRVRDARLIESSDLFDREWYLAKNSDVATSGVDPVQHYLAYGGFEGRDPGPGFNSRWYLDSHEDVRNTGVNPLVHYLKYGRSEGRETSFPVFRLRGMYEYSKQTGRIVFEDSPEQIYMQRPKLIGGLGKKLNEGLALCPQPYVSVLEDAAVIGGESLIIVEDDIILNDEYMDFNSPDFGKKTSRVRELSRDSVILNEYQKPVLHIEEGIFISCAHDDNYFHWLVECLPKILLVDSLEQFKDIPLLIPDGLHPNLMIALERLNVNKHPLIYMKPGTPYHVERLVFPSSLSRILDRYEGRPVFNQDIVLSHKWVRKVTECLKGDADYSKQPWRNIYLARRQGRRALGNRDEVELMLLKQGFEIVEIEGASLDFQIELFSQAALVVAPTGAALTNMLFCQPGTEVVILMSNHEVTNFYFWTNLGAINNLDITTIVGERLFTRIGYFSVHDDYLVDADLVLDVLGEKGRSGKHYPMNHSRYLRYKTFMTSIVESCSQWSQPSLSVAEAQQLRLFLESIEDVIHLEIYQIQSRQTGGHWQITKGDRSYIRYLSRTLMVIYTILGKPSLGNAACRMFINHLDQMLESVEADHNPRLKAVFFVQERYTWPSLESVYNAFAANPDCDAQLVYVDFRHVNNDKSQDWFTEYTKLHLPIIHCNDYDLSIESPDLVFFLKPYDNIPKQFYIDEIDKVVSRSVYIPYFVNWMALKNIGFLINYHFQLPLHEKAWKIFDSPNFIFKSHVQHGPRKGENVELIGHPRFDVIAKLEKRREEISSTWKRKIANKRVVMWNTHSFIATENWSTFGSFGRQILDYFQSSQQLVLLWRPHPHFFNSLRNGGIMTAEQVEEMIAWVMDNENMILDQTPDYLSAFSVADALISDASSILVEFLLTHKPAMYTFNESNYSIVHENLLPAFYQASTWEEVEKFLQILMDGKDDKLVERMSAVENFMPNVGRDVGKLIMDQCIKDLIAEEINSGKTLLQIESELIGIE